MRARAGAGDGRSIKRTERLLREMGTDRAATRESADGSPYPHRNSPEFERDVRRMFTHIASRYDGFDHVASLGGDFVWRPRALWDLDRFRHGHSIRRVLDVGCGTGDLAVRVAHHFPSAQVVAVDFTAAMLRRIPVRHRGARELERISLGRATALKLPFPDATFDLVTSAFVLRNFSSLEDALRETRRVLAPGGIALHLEITEPLSPRFGQIFHAYFDRVVPWLGAAVKSEGPYRYLPDSLKALPSRADLLRAMGRAGFGRLTAATQSLGVVTTFLGEVGPPGVNAVGARG